MKYDQIKNDFLKEIKADIKNKKAQYENLTGKQQDKAKLKYLEEFKDFTEHMNSKIYEITDRHEIEFDSALEFDEFLIYIKPTFDLLHKMYIDVN